MKKHSFNAVTEPIVIGSPPADFNEISPIIFHHLSEKYEELGQLDLGEEHLTVEPNVFAQIGVIDVDGIRKMWTSVILPQLRLSITGGASLTNVEGTIPKLEEKTVFCDIGSGVGNVCLQVLAETRCKKVVGVEVIPSRHRNAVIAFAKAKEYYPEFFGGKDAIFLQDDLVKCTSRLVEEKVSVVFTHSWMFDDELMKKLSKVVVSVPTVRCVVTSRRLDAEVLSESPLKLVSKVYLSADWNEQAPFYVYTKLE
ncbi:Histone-lysine N-methyltransferase DOT1 domain [Trypanosoma melophagium]|uniref:Histone-lysine N-methyltransferase DOT1 domain n=1 Tax=Trypanosoma melophagium TaxID=715481 RepID=UPI00351A94B5|nr:Histone-lysine N-methyltransferase DOT1 domain [Trypanosoma melophagium]